MIVRATQEQQKLRERWVAGVQTEKQMRELTRDTG